MKSPATPPRFPRLSPWRKLFLALWTFFVIAIAWRLFARAPQNFRLAAIIIAGVLGGILVGLKILGQADRILGALGFAAGSSSAADKQALREFLRQHKTRGQFQPKDMERWCAQNRKDFSKMLELALKLGWVRFMGPSLVITSIGEEVLSA